MKAGYPSEHFTRVAIRTVGAVQADSARRHLLTIEGAIGRQQTRHMRGHITQLVILQGPFGALTPDQQLGPTMRQAFSTK